MLCEPLHPHLLAPCPGFLARVPGSVAGVALSQETPALRLHTLPTRSSSREDLSGQQALGHSCSA